MKLQPALKKALLQRALKSSGGIYNPDRIKTGIILDGISKGESAVFQTDGYSISVHQNNILIINFKNYENSFKVSLTKNRKSPFFLDETKICGNVKIRKVMPSDHFVPFGKKNKVKVSKVLSDKKVPKALRESMLCLEDDEKIIYIQGAGISDEVKAHDGSEVIYINERNNTLKKLYK